MRESGTLPTCAILICALQQLSSSLQETLGAQLFSPRRLGYPGLSRVAPTDATEDLGANRRKAPTCSSEQNSQAESDACLGLGNGGLCSEGARGIDG